VQLLRSTPRVCRLKKKVKLPADKRGPTVN